MKNKIFKTGLMALGGLLAFNSIAAHDEERTHYIEVETKDKFDRSLVTRLGYAIDEIRSDKVYFLGKAEDVEKLKRLQLKAKAYPMQSNWTLNEDIGAESSRYTSYSDVTKELQGLATRFPNIVSLQSLGRSLENRDVPMLRISSRSIAQAEAEALPVAFYTGCHHAREHLSVEVPLLFAKHLVENYGKNPVITRLLDTRELYIAPIVNPDGHVYDYTDGIRGRSWRKNRRANGDGSYGVDLNRNYGYKWGTGGSSSSPRSDTYKGAAPFSEPETQNVRNFVDSQPRMTTLLSFHSFSELILYPWGGSYDKVGEKDGNAADYPVFRKMAQDMAKWNNYKPQQSSELYIASGDTTDWAYGTHGIFSFTFELSPTSMWSGGFYPNPRVINPTFEANIKPMLYMLEFSDNPHRVLTDRIPDFDNTPIDIGIGVASFKDVQL